MFFSSVGNSLIFWFLHYRVLHLCKWHFSLLFIRSFFKFIKLKSCHRISLDILFFALIFLQALLKDRKIACCCFLFYLSCFINSVVFQVFLKCIFPCFWPFLPLVLSIFAWNWVYLTRLLHSAVTDFRGYSIIFHCLSYCLTHFLYFIIFMNATCLLKNNQKIQEKKR